MSKEAMKLALEASKDLCTEFALAKVREILEEALAKQEQGEPVALEQEREAFEAWCDSFFVNKGHAAHSRFSDCDAYCIDEIQNQWKGWKERAKRTTPQQRTWVGLSVFEINDLVENTEFEDYHGLIEAVEAKLKERNT